MSQENVEIVRRGYEAYARGDMDAAVAPFDPEIEIYDHDIPDAGTTEGWRVVSVAGRLGEQLGELALGSRGVHRRR
jgi:ketosteroid isomerase-like protein